MTDKKQGNDPHARREAEKYDAPIPSREFILETLQTLKLPSTQNALAQALRMDMADEQQQEALRRRIKAMLRDRQLKDAGKGRFDLIDPDDLVAGKVVANRAGFGFVVTASGEEDLYLSFHEMRKVFDGDEVLAMVVGDNRGKLEGEIVEVTKHNTEHVVGRLFVEGEKMRVVPDNPKIQHTVFIDKESSVNADHEQIVVVEITRQPEARRAPRGIITRVLGESLDPGMEIEVAIHNFGIPNEWPQDVLAQAQAFSEPDEQEKKTRVDLRKLPLLTIDGEDARDFDDALYCEKKRTGGWRLWVAIADVSHYVDVNTPLDAEAQKRATSVYFPEQVVPMLPEALSNGLCSLRPAVDRLCMVCEMTVSGKGKLTGYQFYEAVMHSHARLTYTEVGRILQEKGDNDSPIREEYSHLLKPLDELHNLYKALRKQRELRGAMDFDTVETRLVFNEERKIENIVPVVRNDAHKLVEECMLCANLATASFLEKQDLPTLYRVHEGPNEKKLANLRGFLGELGLSLGGGDEPSPKDYLALSESIKERRDADVIQIMMLRSMNQAVYQPENKGHFGLAYEAYAHFTSPIRRYPDLLVHRAIRYILRSGKRNKHTRPVSGKKPLTLQQIYPYDLPHMRLLGEHCSMAERRADDATRDVMSWLKCEYLQEHLGDDFSGVIVSVAPFGFFVELDDLYVEGLVHVSELGDDFYNFDQAKQRLLGEKSGRIFRLGDSVKVKVSRIELDERKVHLELLDGPGGKKTGKAAGKKTAGKKQVGGKKQSEGKKHESGKFSPRRRRKG